MGQHCFARLRLSSVVCRLQRCWRAGGPAAAARVGAEGVQAADTAQRASPVTSR